MTMTVSEKMKVCRRLKALSELIPLLRGGELREAVLMREYLLSKLTLHLERSWRG